MYECSNGHPQRGPLDTLPNGDCRHCDKARVAKYRARRKQAMGLMRHFEAAGIDVDNLDKAERVVLAAKIIELASDGMTSGRAQLLLQKDAKLREIAMAMVDQLAEINR